MSEIDLTLSNPNLSRPEIKEQVDNLLEFLESGSSDLKISNWDSTLKANHFLRSWDSSFVVEVQDALQNSDLNFLKENATSLYSLFFKIQNQLIYEKHFQQNRTDSIQIFKETADWIAMQFQTHLSNSFLISQKEFYNNLNQNQLNEKLTTEFFYNQGHQVVSKDAKAAIVFFTDGAMAAQNIGDKKRHLDCLSRLQYAIEDTYGFINIVLGLGKHLQQETSRLGHVYTEARTHYNTGNALSHKGELHSALIEFEKAQAVYSKYNHEGGLIQIYERLGVVNRRLGNFDTALKNYEKSIGFEDANSRTRNRVRYLIGIGLTQFQMAKFTKAEKSTLEALYLALELEDTSNEIIALINLGMVNAEIGNYDAALEFQLQALQKANKAESPHSISSIWSHLTETHVMTNNIKAAKASADTAVAKLSKFDYGLLNGRTFVNIGKLQLKIGNPKSAKETFEKALEVFTKIGSPQKQVEVLSFIGECQRQLGNYAAAIQSLIRASDVENKYDDFLQRWNTHYFLGRVYQDQNEVNTAEKYFEKSIAQVRSVANDLTDYEQRINFSQKIQPIFEQMVLLQLAQNNTEKALHFAELERAQVFKLQLQDQKQIKTPQITHKAGFGISKSVTDNQTFDFVNLQSRLDDSTVIVEYEVTDRSLVIWVIGSDKFHAQQLDISRNQIEQLISRFRETLKKNSIRQDFNASFEQASVLSEQLYQFFIEPIETHLSHAKLIHFIPDETLYYIPFAALKNPKNRFLVEQFEMVYSPSATILQKKLSKAEQLTGTPKNYKFLGIAADVKLKFAVQEAEEVAKLSSNPKTLVGPEATEHTTQFEMQNGAKVVLFSSHGRVNPKRPNQSAILLNKDPNRIEAPANDGALTVLEIMRLRCDCIELVYLSACETGSGRLYKGEGIVGLQRGFMLTGARTVIANLWEIQDEAAKNLTVHFFEKWFTGKYTKTEALRLAQITAIDDLRKNPIYGKAHPYFWAPAVLTGAYN